MLCNCSVSVPLSALAVMVLVRSHGPVVFLRSALLGGNAGQMQLALLLCTEFRLADSITCWHCRYVMDVYMPRDRMNRAEHRGFGFVTFETEAAILRVASYGGHMIRYTGCSCLTHPTVVTHKLLPHRLHQAVIPS